MTQLNELIQRRAGLGSKSAVILSGAEAAKRDFTNEERQQLDDYQAQIDALTADIERLIKAEATQRTLQGGLGRMTSPTNPADLDMPEADLRNYSLVRAIRAVAASKTAGNARVLEEAGLEMEASAAVAKRLGRDPQGFFVPADVQKRNLLPDTRSQTEQLVSALARLVEQRDLLVGTTTAGGHTVATDLLTSSFVELLRNRMMVRAAGATVLSDLVGPIAIPRQTGGATAYWVAENGAPTESQQAFDQVTMTPRTIGAFTDYSRRLLLQSSIDVEAFVRDDLTRVLAIGIDRAALHGSGASNQPTGLALISGIGSVAGGTNGAAPTWANLVGLETEVAIDNADIGTLAYMTNARVRGKLKQTPKVASTDSVMLWQDSATPLNGYPAWVTNQVRNDLDKGTSTGVCSAILFGNWRDLLIGFWGVLDILVDPYTGSTAGTTRVVAMQDTDVNARHPESFAGMLDALTT
jgi:HK97 family phage major capsid protein